MTKVGQVVILAAGKGTRLRPFTEKRPKVLAPVLGRTIIEQKLDVLNPLTREVVLVVGYKKEMIKSLVGNRYKGLRVRYVEQKKPLGSGHALKKAAPVLQDRFLVMNGDDIYAREDVVACLKKFPSLLVKEVKDVSQFGAVITDNGGVKSLIEKPKKQVTNLANIGLYFVPKSVLSFDIEKSERGEYEITDYIRNLAGRQKVKWVKAGIWLPLSYPWHLLDINRLFLEKTNRRIEGRVERGAVVKGRVVLEKGAVIKSGSYLEGPVYVGRDVSVGPNSHLRPYTVLRKGVKVGRSVEIKGSIIGEATRIPHLSYIGDSVVGSDCNIGAGTITANLRFDREPVRSMVGRKMVSTGRTKFGAVLGHGVKTGINVSLMPGVMVASQSVVRPHTVVKRNVGHHS